MTSDSVLPQQRILVSQLTVDLQNPRLPEVQPDTRAALRAMLKTQGEKILSLADHIIGHGLNPATMPIVMPAEEDDAEGLYTVLDGNRRISTLKLLEAPSIAEGVLQPKLYQRLKRLAREYETKAVAEVWCIVAPDRAAADPWIQLTHRGQNQGAGLVEWDGQVAARYDARNGEQPFVLQVLDYVHAHGSLSEPVRQRIDEGKYPVTNIGRLLNTPYVREKLGIESAKGHFWTCYPEEEVLKGLTRMVEDFGRGDPNFTVTSIKNINLRRNYIDSFGTHELPDTQTALTQARPVAAPGSSPATTPSSPGSKPNGAKGAGGSSSGSSGTGSSGATPARPKAAGTRSTLIPKSCRFTIGPHRIQGIYKELRELNADTYPNSVAVLFRVFLELSLDHHLQHNSIWPQQQIDNSTLAHKLNAVATFFETSGAMTIAELEPIRRAAGGQTILAASIKTMNSYVHSRHSSAIASELRVAWDDLQRFIECIWA